MIPECTYRNHAVRPLRLMLALHEMVQMTKHGADDKRGGPKRLMPSKRVLICHHLAAKTNFVL